MLLLLLLLLMMVVVVVVVVMVACQTPESASCVVAHLRLFVAGVLAKLALVDVHTIHLVRGEFIAGEAVALVLFHSSASARIEATCRYAALRARVRFGTINRGIYH